MTAVGLLLALAAYLGLIGLDWEDNVTPSAVRGAVFALLAEALVAGCVIIAWQAAVS